MTTASASPKSVSPSNSTNKFRCTRRGRPAHGPVLTHKSRPPVTPTFRAGLRPASHSQAPPLHSQRQKQEPGHSARSQLHQALDGTLNPNPAPVQLRPKFCPFPTPRPLSRPVGPPQPSASAKDCQQASPHAQSLRSAWAASAPRFPSPASPP